jgi:hypothetical protein
LYGPEAMEGRDAVIRGEKGICTLVEVIPESELRILAGRPNQVIGCRDPDSVCPLRMETI